MVEHEISVTLYDIINFLELIENKKEEVMAMGLYNSYTLLKYIDTLKDIEGFMYTKLEMENIKPPSIEEKIKEITDEIFILRKCGLPYSSVQGIIGEENVWCQVFFM